MLRVRSLALYVLLSRLLDQRVDIRFSAERERCTWGYDQLFFIIKCVRDLIVAGNAMC